MPGLLGDLGQGLISAGAALNPRVMEGIQQQQRMAQQEAYAMRDLQVRSIIAGVQNGSIAPDQGQAALQRFGVNVPMGPSIDARSAQADLQAKQQFTEYLQSASQQPQSGGMLPSVLNAPPQIQANPYFQKYANTVVNQLNAEKNLNAPQSPIGKLQSDLKAGKISQDVYEAELAKMTNVPPRTRNRIDGPNEIQEEYDPTTKKWNEIGRGPRFAKSVVNVNSGEKGGGAFEGRNGDIMAALAERGISLPAGFRSKSQQVALLNSLSKRNPDLSPDQIADKIKQGQLDITGEKKEVMVAGSQAGKISYAENEIKQTIPLVREASAKLPRGQFVPWERLKQMGEKELSNPDLAEFKMYMTSLSNAYDMLAARGGTDMEKRKENRKIFDTATSPEALDRVLNAVMKEAQASQRAARDSMRPGQPPSAPPKQEKSDPLGIR